MENLFAKHKPRIVINLAAQAGVRHSINNPATYIQSNIVGFLNILECCRHFKVKNFLYASSSSVYGGNKKMPYSEKHGVDHPVSLYAASKKSNELMAHTYSHLFNIPTIGLRFFTVYGPWGRPDMALFLFTKAIIEGEPIQVFNNGNMSRDFTYIDDIVNSIIKLIDKPAYPLENSSLNIGTIFTNNKISNIEKAINFFETFFDNDTTKIPKEFKKFKALFQKNNLSRKECILLPFKTLRKDLKS